MPCCERCDWKGWRQSHSLLSVQNQDHQLTQTSPSNSTIPMENLLLHMYSSNTGTQFEFDSTVVKSLDGTKLISPTWINNEMDPDKKGNICLWQKICIFKIKQRFYNCYLFISVWIFMMLQMEDNTWVVSQWEFWSTSYWSVRKSDKKVLCCLKRRSPSDGDSYQKEHSNWF